MIIFSYIVIALLSFIVIFFLYETSKLEISSLLKLKPKNLDENFPTFRKIPRLYKEIQITEKIDGTNGIIQILGNGHFRAGSRNRWLSLDDDNHGFYRWVEDNWQDIKLLGTGTFYGEFYGQGINRRYGLKEKRFALFLGQKIDLLPCCCEMTSVLYTGEFCETVIKDAIERLKLLGSYQVPGYYNPEGIVIYHKDSRMLYKVTIDKKHKYEQK